jgi:2-dehydro-3-deoxygluconokinase
MPQKKVVTFGEIMMRLSTPGHSRFTQSDSFNIVYGGSEANVAMSLAGFGIDAEHVTRFPSNDFGKSAVQALRKGGLQTSHIVFGNERMGLYFLENGAMQRSSRIIYDRFDSAFSHIKPGMIDWNDVFKDAAWFHWTGITPAISQGAASVCLEALQAAISTTGEICGSMENLPATLCPS